ncbi:hypothetical protein [uncultured Clostridium sp.]|uniref:hypothetical protein n=1 Tax=uncultured Clostridium sp. TaxID=59620 RepID=UPI0032173291
MTKVRCNNSPCRYNKRDIEELFGLIISDNSYCTKDEIDIFNEECMSYGYPYSMPEYPHKTIDEYIIL